MKKLLIFSLLTTLLLCGCACQHEWIEANCESPKTCSICGVVEGAPLIHTWIEATCTAPRTCMLCETADGEALGHKPGDWTIESTDFVTATESHTRLCTVCGSTIESMEQPVSLIHDDKFMINTDEFVERLNLIYKQTGRHDLNAEYFENKYDEMMISILRDDTVILLMYMVGTRSDISSGLLDNLQTLTPEQSDERSICYFFTFIPYTSINDGGSAEDFLILFDDYTLYEDALFGPLMACDPSLSLDEALASINNGWTETHNFLVSNGDELIHDTQCGDLYVKFINTIAANGMVSTIIFPSDIFLSASGN